MALGRSGRALERLLGGLHRSFGGSWRALACYVGAYNGSEIQKILKNVWLHSGFLMDFRSKICSWGEPKS